MVHEECRRGAHIPSLGREPVAGYTTEVCEHGLRNDKRAVNFSAAGHYHPLTT